ncbi:MAG: carboxypeptidase regulatory-like domain-containing protein [bacterium]|nr:carboxypeptidase regulatory-like domain-containing protein [bacterium]
MFTSLQSTWGQLAMWLAEYSLQAGLVIICVQLLLLVCLAWTASRFPRLDSATVCRLWLVAICLMLTLAPLRLIFGGWDISVRRSSSGTAPAAVADRSRRVASELVFNRTEAALGAVESQFAWPPATVLADDGSDEFPSQREVGASGTASNPAGNTTDVRTRWAAGDQKQSDLRSARHEALSSTSSYSARLPFISAMNGGNWLAMALVGIYLLAVFAMALRLILATAYLRRVTSNAKQLDDGNRQLASQAAKQLGLAQLPTIGISGDITMPLTWGVSRPVILLPIEFQKLEPSERLAVLLHELAHVARRDLWGEGCCRCLQVMYWFHPAAWLAARQLRMVREMATDELVVRSGVNSVQYAEGLISVLEKLSGCEPSKLRGAPAVCMSAESDFESRIRSILTCKLGAKSSRQFGLVVAVVLTLVAGASSIQFRVRAQDASTATNSGALAQVSSPQNNSAQPAIGDDGLIRVSASSLESQTSLVDCILGCPVFPVDGDEHGPIFTVSGKVTSPDGQPAAGAVVLLRESPQARVSAESRMVETEDRHLAAVPDVFAKTIADAQGQYRFENIKSPAIPKLRADSWQWSVVAATQGGSVGFVELDPVVKPTKNITGADISLLSTSSISGVVVSEAGETVEDAVVSLSTLGEARSQRWLSARDFVAWMSALTPRTRTQADGTFRIFGVPPGMVASVQAQHSDYVGGGASIVTSDDMPVGKHPDPGLAQFEQFNTVRSPATITMERGSFISGTITCEGTPVEGAKFSLGSSTNAAETDSQGRFRLRCSAMQLELSGSRGAGEIRCWVRGPEESDLLYRYAMVSKDEIEQGEPLAIELQRGVRLQGSVTCEGQPVEGIFVSAVRVAGEDALISRSSDSKPDGSFELVLPPTTTTIFLSTTLPGFKLPDYREARNALDGNVPQEWPQRELKLDPSQLGTIVQLQPFEIESTGSLQVLVTMPDGTPADGATVVVRDTRNRQPADRFPPTTEEVSAFVDTNPQGRGNIPLKGIPSAEAVLTAWLRTQEQAFFGRIGLTEKADGMHVVRLSPAWMVRGRVTLNGEPVGGARIRIGQVQQLEGNRSAFTTSNHVFTETKEDGRYQAAVEPGHRYSIWIESLPGNNTSINNGKTGFPPVDDSGVIEVDDFELQTGEGEIAGRVVGSDGKPMEGVQVGIDSRVDVRPGLWLGHSEKSQSRTDANGRFHLRGIPAGTYDLTAYGPQNPQGKRNYARVEASTGNLLVRIPMQSNTPPALPTLPVRAVSDF